MFHIVKRQVYFVLGLLFFIIGLVGVLLPLLPTTPFMILAAACFAKSSPRFHQALLNNRYIGTDLRRWEQHGTMYHSTKKKATLIIVLTFTISLLVLLGEIWLQLLLVIIAIVLLLFLWRIPEQNESSVEVINK